MAKRNSNTQQAQQAITLEFVTNEAIQYADTAQAVDAVGQAVSTDYAAFFGSPRWIVEPENAEKARVAFSIADLIAKNSETLAKFLGVKADWPRFYAAWTANASKESRKTTLLVYQHEQGITPEMALKDGLTYEPFYEAFRTMQTRTNARWQKVAGAARKFLQASITPEAEEESAEDKAAKQWQVPLIRGVESVDKAMLTFFNKYPAKDKAGYAKYEDSMKEVNNLYQQMKKVLKEALIVVQ